MWAAPRKASIPLPHSMPGTTVRWPHGKSALCGNQEGNNLVLANIGGRRPIWCSKSRKPEFPMFIVRLFLRNATIRRVSAALLFGGVQKSVLQRPPEIVRGLWTRYGSNCFAVTLKKGIACLTPHYPRTLS